jgi:hypothetical protein
MSDKPEVQVTVTPATSATSRDVNPEPAKQSEAAIIKEWMDADPVSAIRRIVAAAKAPYIADPAVCTQQLDIALANYPEHKPMVMDLLAYEASKVAIPDPTLKAGATPLVSTRTAYVYRNTSEIALPIPELGITIPAGAYSAPLLEETPTLKAFSASGMLVKEVTTMANVPNNGNTAVVQGNKVNEMMGKQAPVVGGPRNVADLAAINPATKPGIHMLEIKQSKPGELIKAYEGKSGVKDALTRSVVAIRDGSNPNPYGEIPQEAMSSILQVQGKEFATEVSSGQYVEDEAQKIITAATVAAGPARPAAVVQDPNAPAELKPWLSMSGVQKKMSIYKTADAAVLTNLRNYERDTNVISCIDTRLSEIAGK